MLETAGKKLQSKKLLFAGLAHCYVWWCPEYLWMKVSSKSTHCCSSVRHSECTHPHLSNHMPLPKTSLSPIFHSSSVLMNWSDIGYFLGIYIHSHLSTLLLFKVNEQGHCLHSHPFEMIFPLHLLWPPCTWLHRVVYGYTVQVLLYIFGFIYILILYCDRGWKN